MDHGSHPTPFKFRTNKEDAMSRGDKSSYTDKQKRKAEHIEESYKERGVSQEEAEKRAWATVNKEDGGGNKSGSGRKNSS
jgi:plasmid stabilization system protein ParE